MVKKMTMRVPNKKYMVEWDDAEICPNCGSTDIGHDMDRCETYCNRCGYVISNQAIEYGRQHTRSRTMEF